VIKNQLEHCMSQILVKNQFLKITDVHDKDLGVILKVELINGLGVSTDIYYYNIKFNKVSILYSNKNDWELNKKQTNDFITD
jgi:hypothetical protein